MASRSDSVTLDIVIPLYNEEEVIGLLVDALREALSEDVMAEAGIRSFRCIFVDDGSTDSTASLLSEHIRSGFPATLVRLSRNFGHQNAVTAGLDHVTADVAAILDADLQDPPSLVPEMLAKWREGYDVVYGQRRKRKEGLFKRLGYWTFYRGMAFLADIAIPLDSGDFCLMDRRVVDSLRALPENQRFVRVLRAWVGFRQTGLEYDRPSRKAGRPKYGLARLYRLATDGIASSSTRPLKFAQLFSFLYAFLSFFLLGFFVMRRVFGYEETLPPLALITLFLIVSGNGVVCLCLYILGAYVGRGYLESKRRPSYVVMEVVPPREEASVSGPGSKR